MGRTAMPAEQQKKVREAEQQKKVREAARQMSFSKTAKVFGISKETVSRIVHYANLENRPREKRVSELRRAEARVTPPGCFNVFDRVDWLSGFGAE